MSVQRVNKSAVARRAIKSVAIGLCNLRVRVHEIERKVDARKKERERDKRKDERGSGSCQNYSHYRDRGENRPMFA